MSAAVNALRERLSHIRNTHTKDVSLWKQWLDEPLPLTPWQAWTLLGLVRHRSRQQFVALTIKYRLHADQVAIAAAGAMGHPDIPQKGIVPGLTDWEYFFHGRGCCLTHRLTGESIDVDFYDSTADWFDDFFYINYLRSLREPTYIEARLTSLHRSFDTVRLAMAELVQIGLLEELEDRKPMRLAFDADELGEILDGIELNWHDEFTQLAMGAAVGDWFLVNKLESNESTTSVKENLATCRDKRTSYLVNRFRNGSDQADVLQALQDLESPMLPFVVSEALRGKPSGVTSAALAAIDEWNDAAWCEEVETLMARIDPNGEIPGPYIWHKCAQFLLRHGKASTIKQQLRHINSNCLGDASILALEYFPDIAIETFRRALRSEIPCNRITAAAALAILDQSWSRNELASVLDESNDHVRTTECRSALMTTHSQECHQRVLDWEHSNPRETEEGPYISMDEMMLRGSDSAIQWEMEKMHDHVISLRQRIQA